MSCTECGRCQDVCPAYNTGKELSPKLLIMAIRDQGGVVLSNGDRMLPDPILIGRDADKVERLAKRFNVERWSTDLDKALADRNDTIFFDITI